MDLVHLEDTVTGSCVSGQCVENLHNNMEIEESMLWQKHCEPIKNLPAITICDRKCCSFVNRELPFIKICPERGRYRVGPFLMPRPFGIEEESLINFCMDDDLKKGEMLFQTNFYGITRNDIMSLSPRSIINMKLQDHVGGEYRNASVAGGKFIPADLYAKSIRPWEKDKVRSSAEMHQRRIDVAEHNAGEAIQKRRLHQLRRSRRMGHGPRR